MSRRRFLLAVLAVVALVIAGAVWIARPQKTKLTLEVYPGTPGLAFQGTAEVDGSSRELAGTVPKQFVLEGYRVTYSLTSAEEAGEFRVRALIGDVAIGSSGSGNPPRNGVRGWVKSSWGRSGPISWIESFHKDEPGKWLTPPP
jgi:hypothetical protein